MLTPALRQEQGEIGNIVSLRVFEASYTFDCHRLVIDLETKTKAISRDIFKLVITNKQLILLQPLPNQPYFGRITEVYELQALGKLKYHKSQAGTPGRTNSNKPQLGLLIMELKTGKVINYAMSDPLPAVEVLKQRMQDLGITGNITRPAKTRRIIANAQHCLEQSKEIQLKFSLEPSLALIEEMMDLLKTATEKFAEANESEAFAASIEEIHRFLQRDDVRRILDAHAKSQQEPKRETQPAGMSASTTTDLLGLEDDSLTTSQGQKERENVMQESLLDTPLPPVRATETAPDTESASLLVRRNMTDLPFLSPVLWKSKSNEEMDPELVRSVKHELLSAMSPRPFRVEEDAEVRELHAKALTFEDIDMTDLDLENELGHDEMNLLDIESNTWTSGSNNVIVSSQTDTDLHDLSAMLEDMDNELQELLSGGSNSSTAAGVIRGSNGVNSTAASVLDKIDYETLGLEDFDKMLDEL
jgi:hypothetical protein